MAGWWSEAQCARRVKTYQEMPRTYKVLENSSLMLTPICFVVAASLGATGWVRDCDWAMAGIGSFILSVAIVNNIRGRAAIESGVEPGPLKAPQSYWMEKVGVVLYVVLFAVFLFKALIHPGHSVNLEGLSWTAWTLGLLVMQVSTFARGRYMSCLDTASLRTS